MKDSCASSSKLVLIEDSSDDELLSLRAISKSGVPCQTEVIRHGGEAVFLLLSPKWPVPSLVVLDFHLPGSNGLEVLRQLRGHKKMRHVPIIMFSSLGSERDVSECMEEGANSFVQKPVDAKSYTEKITSIVRYWITVHRLCIPNAVPTPVDLGGVPCQHRIGGTG